MIKYEKDFVRISVQHKPSREVYEAILLEKRRDGSCLFQIVGERAHRARVFVESDNMEVDTLFSPGWIVITK